MRIYLAPEVISSFNSALGKLTGYERRQYAAELCEKFFDNSPRKTERFLNVSRDMVELGVHERRTGIRCLESFEHRGAKKKESTYPELEQDIKSIIDKESQIDPSFKTQRCYVRVTASYIRKELVMNNSYEIGDFCTRSINNILNRLGYSLKKVEKIKPRKKIPETDAIFANVHQHQDKAKSDPRILHISLDVKAKVKIGKLSRGGYARTQQATVAEDHDHKYTATLVPLGIHELNTEDTYLQFGNSKETPDFIVDGLEWWYSQRPFDKQTYDLLLINLDNGSSVAGNTKQFLKRMVAFSQKIGVPIQLVYYPPYHSKYNTIERFWAAVEQYWKPLILDTIDNTIDIAKKVAWKGLNPIVNFSDRVYEKGVKVSSEVFKELEKFIVRNPDLKKWDVLINPFASG